MNTLDKTDSTVAVNEEAVDRYPAIQSWARSLGHITIGSQWKKPSCPVPTIATIIALDIEVQEVYLRCGRQRVWWPIDRFVREFTPYTPCEEQIS